jgi:hypothetical protein
MMYVFDDSSEAFVVDVNISGYRGADLKLAPKCLGERVRIKLAFGILEGIIQKISNSGNMMFYGIEVERFIQDG